MQVRPRLEAKVILPATIKHSQRSLSSDVHSLSAKQEIPQFCGTRNDKKYGALQRKSQSILQV